VIYDVNTTSGVKSFDLPFSALVSPLEIAEVYYSNHDARTPFKISNHEETDVSVSQGRRQVVLPDILGDITLEIIKCFAAFFWGASSTSGLSSCPASRSSNVVATEFGGTRMRGRAPVKEQQSRANTIWTSWRPRGANLVYTYSQ
jgi:hypothetical protein